jgi:hypothetical protein
LAILTKTIAAKRFYQGRLSRPSESNHASQFTALAVAAGKENHAQPFQAAATARSTQDTLLNISCAGHRILPDNIFVLGGNSGGNPVGPIVNLRNIVFVVVVLDDIWEKES